MFIDYLQEQHAKDYTGLDDDMPDAFNDWLENMSTDEVIEHSEEWGKKLIKK